MTEWDEVWKEELWNLSREEEVRRGAQLLEDALALEACLALSVEPLPGNMAKAAAQCLETAQELATQQLAHLGQAWTKRALRQLEPAMELLARAGASDCHEGHASAEGAVASEEALEAHWARRLSLLVRELRGFRERLASCLSRPALERLGTHVLGQLEVDALRLLKAMPQLQAESGQWLRQLALVLFDAVKRSDTAASPPAAWEGSRSVLCIGHARGGGRGGCAECDGSALVALGDWVAWMGRFVDCCCARSCCSWMHRNGSGAAWAAPACCGAPRLKFVPRALGLWASLQSPVCSEKPDASWTSWTWTAWPWMKPSKFHISSVGVPPPPPYRRSSPAAAHSPAPPPAVPVLW